MADKALFIIQDGVADRPLPELDGRTPLEAARTPAMDQLLARGSGGLIDIIGPGIAVGTDVGHLVLFGQDINQGHYGRGPMEAAGLGIDLKPGDVALRFNFAWVDEDGCVRDRRAGRIRDGAPELAEAISGLNLDDDLEVAARAATEHRGVIVLRGEGLSDQVSDSDPGQSGRPILSVVPTDSSSEAARTAELVNAVIQAAAKVLGEHPLNKERVTNGQVPANCVITRGAGMMRPYVNLTATTGLKVACVSGECTVLGIARLAGATPISQDGMTANLDSELNLKAVAALEALQDYDLVYVHVKGADIAGHDRQPLLKKKFIEETDRMVARIAERVSDAGLLYVFGADHATLCSTGEHSGDPVPVFMSGPGIETDSVSCYGERYCAEGGLGRMAGRELLLRVYQELGAPKLVVS